MPFSEKISPVLLLAAALTSGIEREARGQGVVLLADAPGLQATGAEARNAYDWATARFGARYVSFSDVAAADFTGADVLWWHEDSVGPLPQSAVSTETVQRVAGLVRDDGKGLLLTGTATRYAVTLGLESTAPLGPVREPATSGNWGFHAVAASPLFNGLPETFSTMSAGVAVDNVVSWWPSNSTFHGIWLAEPEWGGGVVAAGQYNLGQGRVIAISSGAFEWSHPGTNANRGNLERLATNALTMLATPRPSGDVLAYWPLDETTGTTRTVEVVSGTSDQIRNRFGRPEFAPGVLGSALRLDGWSTWLQHGATVNTALTGVTVEGWVAARAYPYQDDAAIISQSGGGRGIFLGVDTYGKWNFSVGATMPGGSTEWKAVFAPAPLPKFRWVHVAGVYSAGSGLSLYADGTRVAQQSFASTALAPATNSTLLLGRANGASTHLGLFAKGAFNGLVDEFRVYNRALSGAEVAALAVRRDFPEPEVLPAPDRFAANTTRPIFHPMPPADWTNEPHGMIHWKGRYHVFYQENPNGPYFGNQHWGHVYSEDLVHWTAATSPFWPTPGPDSNGTWSGTTVDLGNQVAALYTSNEGGQSQSVAFSNEDLLINWSKFAGNAVIGTFPPGARAELQGHRDPYVFQANGFHYAIVGGGYPDTGGTLFLYRSTNLTSWDYRGELFSAPPDKAGTMWEMPYFFPISESGWGTPDGKWCLLINPLPNPRPKYWLGTLQGERFVPDADYATPRLADVGPHLLSPGVARDPQGRVWTVGVVTEDRTTEAQAEAGWANGFSLPRLVSLDSAANRLRWRPAPELEAARGPVTTLAPGLRTAGNYPINLEASAFELRLRARMGSGSTVAITFRDSPTTSEKTVMRYRKSAGTLELDRSLSSLSGSVGKWGISEPVPLEPTEALDLRVFVDRSVVEAFVNERAAMTARIYPTRTDSNQISLQVEEGFVTIDSLEVWPMAGGGAGPGSVWMLF